MNWSEFFAMGGYGAYVWSSYAIAFVVLAANVLAPMMQHKRLLAGLARRLRRKRAEA